MRRHESCSRLERAAGFRRTFSALRSKLKYLNSVNDLNDLRIPGNHLEALKGDRKGQLSIRINDQYRICFVWAEGKVGEVEIVDYH